MLINPNNIRYQMWANGQKELFDNRFAVIGIKQHYLEGLPWKKTVYYKLYLIGCIAKMGSPFCAYSSIDDPVFYKNVRNRTHKEKMEYIKNRVERLYKNMGLFKRAIL